MKLHDIEIDSIYRGRETDEDNWKHDKWDVELYYNDTDEEIKVEYRMGTGHHGAEPEKEDVIQSLFIDSEAEDLSFEEWCSELGMNDDSIKALKIYKDCKQNAKKLRQLLGHDYEAIRDEIRELEL